MFKRKRITFVLSIIFILGIALVSFMQRQYVVPIVMYHSVTPNPAAGNRLAVSVNTFERQMRFLKERRYNVVPLESVAALLKEKKKIPPKTITITLDDGYKDGFQYAFPILKKYNLPATMFIIVNEVGRPQNDRLSWDEIKAMQASGMISFGSHAVGPDPLIKMKTEADLRYQIFESKRILEEKLLGKVNLFSYPEGFFNARIRQLVIDAGYHAAVATNPGKNYPDDDVFALKRIKIAENARNLFVFAVEASGYYTFMKEHKKRGKK